MKCTECQVNKTYTSLCDKCRNKLEQVIEFKCKGENVKQREERK